jgi:hypothetical protein
MSFSIGKITDERLKMRTALRRGQTTDLTVYWDLYKLGEFPYTKRQREEDIYYVDDVATLDWVLDNNFVSALSLLKRITIYNDDFTLLEHLIHRLQASDFEPDTVWRNIITEAVQSFDVSVLKWVIHKDVALKDFISDDLVDYLLESQLTGDDDEECPPPTAMLKWLHESEYITFSRDMLETAVTGRNQNTILMIVNCAPGVVCKASVYLLAQVDIWRPSVWKAVLSACAGAGAGEGTDNILSDIKCVNYIVEHAGFPFDGRVFMEFGAIFTEEHALQAISRNKYHVLENLVKHCKIETTARLQQEVLHKGNDDMIMVWRRLQKPKTFAF